MNSIRMNRVTIYFLALLAVATLSAGAVYQNGLNLLRGQGDIGTGLSFLTGTVVFGFTLLVLGRIVYLTTPKSK